MYGVKLRRIPGVPRGSRGSKYKKTHISVTTYANVKCDISTESTRGKESINAGLNNFLTKDYI